MSFTFSIRSASTRTLLVGVLGGMALLGSTSSWSLDASAAEALARRNNCFKCHSSSGSGEAPPFKVLAAKYKGKAEAPDHLLKHLKTAPKVKAKDSEDEEEHLIIKAKDDADISNLVAWVLAQ
ncbi:MAG: c-type cytochrome [Leptothrix ochracea]|uniref:c-type cytochrome n=1 Tax=Leptothrix ochracea TaxID=735331 RepID=UPI0034E2A120